MAERKNKLNIISENLKGDISSPISVPTQKVEEEQTKRTSVFFALSDIDYINKFLIEEQYVTGKRMTFADALTSIVRFHKSNHK